MRRHILAVLAAVGLAAMAQGAAAAEVVLDLEGGDKALGRQLLASSRAATAIERATEDAKAEDRPASAEDIIALAGADYRRLLSTLYGAGYFAPTVSIRVDGREVADISPFVRITRIDQLVIDVSTGPAFSFGTVVVTPLAPGTALPENVAPGQPARTQAIEGAVQGALSDWRAIAYAKPLVTGQQIDADNRTATLSAGFTIDPGRTARFGRIGVEGTDKVRPDRVLQIAAIQSGKPFDPDKMAEAARRLRAAGAFSAVTITEADEISPDGALDLTIDVTEARQRRIGAGAEYSTTDGLSVSAFWLHRNIRHAAERLRFDASIKQIGTTNGGTNFLFSALYTRPATFTPDTDAVVGLSAESLDEDTYTSNVASLTFGIDRYIDERMDASLYFLYSYSNATDAFGDRSFNTLALQGRFRYDGRDNPTASTKGYYAEARLWPFYLADDSVFGGRMTVDGRAYRPLGDRLVLAGRVQLGSIVGAEIEQVPPQYLFYAGGGDSIRGFPYESISVELPGDKRTGGLSRAILSLESRLRVTDTIGAVAFYDVGTVSADSWPRGGETWYAGAGLGARYATPIGPLRVDLATPVQGGNTGDIELYIGIGESF